MHGTLIVGMWQVHWWDQKASLYVHICPIQGQTLSCVDPPMQSILDCIQKNHQENYMFLTRHSFYDMVNDWQGIVIADCHCIHLLKVTLSFPFFFGNTTIGDTHSICSISKINSASRSLSISSLIFFANVSLYVFGLCFLVLAPSFKGIVCCRL